LNYQLWFMGDMRCFELAQGPAWLGGVEPRFGFDVRGFNVDEVVSRYVDRIRGFLDLACVIVFGSRARGDWRAWSDIDVVTQQSS